MKAILLAVLFLTLPVAEAAPKFAVVTDGIPSAVIVKPDRPTPDERFATDELARFLGRAAGKKFTVLPEKEWNRTTPAILVGATDFSATEKLTRDRFEKEEWLLRTTGDKTLILTGGAPRGVLYGVYEFLDRFAGCRFPAVNVEYVPTRRNLSIPGDTKIQGKPFFQARNFAVGVSSPEYQLYFVRNRINGKGTAPEFGFSDRWGRPSIHTFHLYSKDFDKDEYFALQADGKRPRGVSPLGPGQICMSHPEVARLFAAKLREFIRIERRRIDAEGNKEPYPVIYDLSANDNPHKCLCKRCLELEKKYGAYSGVMLEFINKIADDIKKDHPEIFIQTFAYIFTEDPPANIRARDNVIVQLAFLGTEFSIGTRDTLREISHPNNRRPLKLLQEWSKCAKNIAIWDYWILFREFFVSPNTLVSAQSEILKTYAKHGVKRLFIEAELTNAEGRKRPEVSSFADLKLYLGAKLMLDPDTDVNAVVDDFMRIFYGPAAEPMKEYLLYLERRMKAESRPLGQVAIPDRKYLDRDFFLTVNAYLDRAEKLVGSSSDYRDRVLQERFPVDTAYLHLTPRLNLPDNRKMISARLTEATVKAIDKYIGQSDRKTMKQAELLKISSLRAPLPPPAELSGRKCRDFIWSDINKPSDFFTDDPDAAGGKAIRVKCGGRFAEAEFHRRPIQFGLYDLNAKKGQLTRTISRQETPRDERYHLYHLGRSKLSAQSLLWAHWSWLIQLREPQQVYSPIDPDAEYDVFVSAKVTGPAYVENSKSPDAFWVDRIIFASAPKK